MKALGAHHVLDHGRPLATQVNALGIGTPAFVLSTTQTNKHFDEIVELIAPQRRFALIDDPDPIDVRKLKRKSVSTALGAHVYTLDLQNGGHGKAA